MEFNEKLRQFKEMVSKRQLAIEAKIKDVDARREELNKKIEVLNRDAVHAELDGEDQALESLNRELKEARAELTSLDGRRAAFQSVHDDPLQFKAEARELVEAAVIAYREGWSQAETTMEEARRIEGQIKALNKKVKELQQSSHSSRNASDMIGSSLERIAPYIKHITGQPEDPSDMTRVIQAYVRRAAFK